jgi:hypothetical protein
MKIAVKSFPLGNSEIFLYSRPLNEHLKIWKENYSISVIICLEKNHHVERI